MPDGDPRDWDLQLRPVSDQRVDSSAQYRTMQGLRAETRPVAVPHAAGVACFRGGREAGGDSRSDALRRDDERGEAEVPARPLAPALEGPPRVLVVYGLHLYAGLWRVHPPEQPQAGAAAAAEGLPLRDEHVAGRRHVPHGRKALWDYFLGGRGDVHDPLHWHPTCAKHGVPPEEGERRAGEQQHRLASESAHTRLPTNGHLADARPRVRQRAEGRTSCSTDSRRAHG
mmetsp:Transcript_92313/g.287737  ORF Transcript_92313/g.287737 Transcript_92313/m.287737 type:complete len:228 (-) Transcript_92313:140-823(-)